MASIFWNPLFSSALFVLAFVALVVALFRPAHGIMVGVAMALLIAYFSIGVTMGWITPLDTVLLVLGLLLCTGEVLVPGFGVLGVSGLVFTSCGAVLSAPTPEMGAATILTALIAGALVGALLWRGGVRSSWIEQTVLHASLTSEGGYLSRVNPDESYLHRTGVALSNLRPAGTISIDGERLDAQSRGDFIDQGSRVEVIDVANGRLTVRVLRNMEVSEQ